MNKISETKASAGAAKGNRQPAEAKLAELKYRLLEISDLMAAEALLDWDQSTYMPGGGAPARARQSATLSRLAHEKSVDPALAICSMLLRPTARVFLTSRMKQADPGRPARFREGHQAPQRLCRPGERTPLRIL